MYKTFFPMLDQGLRKNNKQETEIGKLKLLSRTQRGIAEENFHFCEIYSMTNYILSAYSLASNSEIKGHFREYFAASQK